MMLKTQRKENGDMKKSQKRKVKTVGVCMLPENVRNLDKIIFERNPHQNRSSFINEALEFYVNHISN